MKNREVRVFIASMMLVSLVAGSLAGPPANAAEKGKVTVTAAEYAGAENKEAAKTSSETKVSENESSKTSDSKASDKKSSSIKPKKEETVYAKIDGSGSVKSVTVSDQLKNISDQSELKDISDLQNIVNVKGDEAFSTMGSSVVWDTADEGAKSAAAGAAQLAAGASQLSDGAFILKTGLNALQSGSGALIEGVQQLDDGAAELNDGMIKFDRDGIQKLVDAFGGDVDDLLDKMNEMLDASRAYKNFSGISDDMDGEVKFVFVTEE